MSDTDYKRLGCVADGCANDMRVTLRGLCAKHYAQWRKTQNDQCTFDGCKNSQVSKGFCATHYTRLQKFGYPGPHELICSHCGGTFHNNIRKKYCSVTCKQRSNKNSVSKEEHFEKLKRRKFEEYGAYCMHCNKVFANQAGAKDRREKKLPAKFCSKQCSFERKKLITKEIHALCRIASYEQNKIEEQQRCKQKAIRGLLAALKRKILPIKKKQEKAAMLCAECCKPVGYAFGRGRLFCSSQCFKQNASKRPEVIEQKKAARKRRKALERGARVGKSFSYRQVFERDGWKCQMCGCKTPEANRGTLAKNAPELDHIQPLSKGGTHSLDNAQTLCRSCNAWKSNKIIPAQQGLFTGLLEAV